MSDFGSILIADDEDLFRVSTCRLLQREGFHCLCAADSEEALSELQDKHYDVLISDIRMPDNHNLEFVRKAINLYSEIAVILVTGYPSTETTIQSVELPIVAYLTKPVKPDDLLKHVRTALKSSQQRRTIAITIEHLKSAVVDLENYQSRPLHRDTVVDIIPVGTVRSIVLCLLQLLELPAMSKNAQDKANLCELLDCSKRSTYRSAIIEAVEALKKTKHLFKSKVLGELRTKLEEVLQD